MCKNEKSRSPVFQLSRNQNCEVRKKKAKMEVEKAEAVELWNRETVPKVMNIVSTRLPPRDLINLLLVNPWIHRNLIFHPSLWLVLDFHEMSDAGNRLVAALSLNMKKEETSFSIAHIEELKSVVSRFINQSTGPRYQNVKHIILEFARDIEDKHLEIVKSKCGHSIKNLEILNLNGCQKISDVGIEFITCSCPKLKVFSIYWNVRVSDLGIRNLVKNCKMVIDLNLSGCKNVTDESLKLIAENYQGLQLLNLTRCVKLTDKGLQNILVNCSSLQSLNLYALSSFTDAAYKKISSLIHLRFLDLCGAQNLSDDGLSCIAKCKNLTSLNLTWCVRVTDQGVITIAESCRSLEFLSLFGIVSVTDKSLEALSRTCSSTITTLDVNGCIGIKRRSHDQLLQLFPKLTCFKVHS